MSVRERYMQIQSPHIVQSHDLHYNTLPRVKAKSLIENEDPVDVPKNAVNADDDDKKKDEMKRYFMIGGAALAGVFFLSVMMKQ